MINYVKTCIIYTIFRRVFRGPNITNSHRISWRNLRKNPTHLKMKCRLCVCVCGRLTLITPFSSRSPLRCLWFHRNKFISTARRPEITFSTPVPPYRTGHVFGGPFDRDSSDGSLCRLQIMQRNQSRYFIADTFLLCPSFTHTQYTIYSTHSHTDNLSYSNSMWRHTHRATGPEYRELRGSQDGGPRLVLNTCTLPHAQTTCNQQPASERIANCAGTEGGFSSWAALCACAA